MHFTPVEPVLQATCVYVLTTVLFIVQVVVPQAEQWCSRSHLP